MVTLVREDLQDRVFVDKAETLLLVDNSTLELTAREYRKLVSAVRAGKAKDNDSGIRVKHKNGGGFIMQSPSGGKIVLGLGDGEGEGVVLTASWNPQTWFSGQNVVPGVCAKSGGLLMSLADIVEYPFLKLGEMCGNTALSVKNKVNYGRLDFTSYTSKLSEGTAEEILKFFASTCAKQEYSRKDKSLIGVAQMLGFGFTLYTAGEIAARKGLRADADSRVCGIVFKKYVGLAKNRAFTLSLYDKTVEVADKTEALRDKEKKPAVLKNNQAMLEELKDEIKDRLRVEGQVYPDTFLRGLAGRFRGIMMQNAKKPEWMDEEGWARILGGNKMKGKDGKVVPDSYYRKSEFLRDSCATEATLRKIIQEMTRQLGLPVIFEAPSQKKLLERVDAEVKSFVAQEGRQKEVEALMEEWSRGVDLSERSMNTASLPYKLRSMFLEKLGVDLFSCTAELPRMIRGALMTSTLSLSEQQEFLHGSPERVLELRSRMIKDAKALRSRMQLVPSSPAIAQVSW